MQKGWNRVPNKLTDLLAKFPIGKDFAASEIDLRGSRWAGSLEGLKNRGLIKCKGFKNKHEKVKMWRVTPKGAELAAALRGGE